MSIGGESGERLTRAIAAIDEANAADPKSISFEGVERPKEQLHAERMSLWLGRLQPEPSDAQWLAARAHHLRRWEIPRSDYPDGRPGYLRWRTAQKKKQAAEVGEILADVGYDQATIGDVQRIIRKEGLGAVADVQTHEDALCLVFLETQLDTLAADLGVDRTTAVLARTWAKMSDTGRALALDLDLAPASRDLLERALAD